nr:MAG TPA: hypothetical protein [Caudoviricetes sp.]
MKRFDLQEYLKNPGRKIVTRDGRSARVVCTDRKSYKFPIVVLIEGTCQEDICKCTKDGLCSYGIECPCDLFFVPEKKSGWVNISRIGEDPSGEFTEPTCAGIIYPTKEDAITSSGDVVGLIGTFKIEREE